MNYLLKLKKFLSIESINFELSYISSNLSTNASLDYYFFNNQFNDINFDLTNYNIVSIKKNVFYNNFINYFLSLNEFNNYYQNISLLHFSSFLNKFYFNFKNDNENFDLMLDSKNKLIFDHKNIDYKRVLNIYQNSHMNFSENLNIYTFIMDIILPTYTLFENYNSYFINSCVLLD